MIDELTGMFKKRYALKGRDWIRNIPKEDRNVLITIGLEKAEHGKLGGFARSKNAKRDGKGRFCKDE